MQITKDYRRDIDGLRAIAVLSIFLFHLDFSFASGGFIGVDVFYVISGFVIFRHLRDEKNYNASSVLAFYARRIRRLFPALLVAIAACLLIGYAILSPREYASTVKSALAAIFSVSNIYFADTLSYFADGARTLPLLHTWSLGVEEQFYLTTPWVLVLLTYLGGGRRLFATILIISLLSFGYNIVASYYLFDGRHAFYMPMSRFWEIGVGALIAFIEKTHRMPKRLSQLFSLVGAVGLSLSFFLIDARMIFPGVVALAPVMATAAIILAAPGERSPLMLILGSAPARFLGRISYSLYLHHWIIIVFAGLLLGRDFSHLEKVLILTGATFSAYISWKFIETPFRNASVIPARSFKISAVLTTLVILSLSILILHTDGAAFRLDPEARIVHDRRETQDDRIACITVEPFSKISRASTCAISPTNMPVDYILWGDSHAGMYSKQLSVRLSESGFSGFSIVMSDCPPLLDVHFSKRKNQAECRELSEAVRNLARDGGVKTIIFSSRWAMLASDLRSPSEGILPKKIYRNSDDAEVPFSEAFEATLRQFNAFGVRTLIIGPTPEFHFNVPNAFIRASYLKTDMPLLLRSDFESRQAKILEVLGRAQEQKTATVIFPHEILCNEQHCRPIMNNVPLYIDDNHLGYEGSSRLAPFIAAQYKNMVRNY